MRWASAPKVMGSNPGLRETFCRCGALWDNLEEKMEWLKIIWTCRWATRHCPDLVLGSRGRRDWLQRRLPLHFRSCESESSGPASWPTFRHILCCSSAKTENSTPLVVHFASGPETKSNKKLHFLDYSHAELPLQIFLRSLTSSRRTSWRSLKKIVWKSFFSFLNLSTVSGGIRSDIDYFNVFLHLFEP